jgi:hypothetical protein
VNQPDEMTIADRLKQNNADRPEVTENPAATSTFTHVRGRSVLGRFVARITRDPVMPPHLPGSTAGVEGAR